MLLRPRDPDPEGGDESRGRLMTRLDKAPHALAGHILCTGDLYCILLWYIVIIYIALGSMSQAFPQRWQSIWLAR